jgi:hypothetical protein
VSDDGKQMGKAPHHDEQTDEVEAHKRAAQTEHGDEAAADDEVEAHLKRPHKQA